MEHTTSFDIVAAGGYDTTIALAADPKGVLVQYIQQQKHEIVPTSYLTAIVGLLQAQGKGFESDLVDGEWISVMNVSGKASPKLQKIIAKMEQLTYSNFDCHQGIFTGNAKLLFGQGDLGSTVKVRGCCVIILQITWILTPHNNSLVSRHAKSKWSNLTFSIIYIPVVYSNCR